MYVFSFSNKLFKLPQCRNCVRLRKSVSIPFKDEIWTKRTYCKIHWWLGDIRYNNENLKEGVPRRKHHMLFTYVFRVWGNSSSSCVLLWIVYTLPLNVNRIFIDVLYHVELYTHLFVKVTNHTPYVYIHYLVSQILMIVFLDKLFSDDRIIYS